MRQSVDVRREKADEAVALDAYPRDVQQQLRAPARLQTVSSRGVAGARARTLAACEAMSGPSSNLCRRWLVKAFTWWRAKHHACECCK